MGIRTIAVVGFLAVLATASGAARAQQPKQPRALEGHAPIGSSPISLFKRLSPSVFIVESLNEKGSVVAIGSGVAVAPDQVVTNKHVIEAGANWRVTQGHKTWPATLAHTDPDHDLCQLKADGLNAPAVTVRLSSTLTVGERVYAIGAPKGLELTLSEGLISGLRELVSSST